MPSIQRERRGLFSGLLFLYIGIVFLLARAGTIDSGWIFLGRYWPILLILAGVAKSIEYFTFGSGKLFRGGEIFLIILIVIFGITLQTIAPFIDSLPKIDWGHGRISFDSMYEDSFPFQEDLDYSLPPGGTLKVRNERGNVILIPITQGQPRIRINKQVYASSEQDAKPLADSLHATVQQSGNQTIITLDRKKNVRGHLEITVPARCSLQVETSYGDISAEGFQGEQHTFRNRHDKIRLSQLSGTVQAENEYGSITADRITGTIRMTTVQGEIAAREITGNLTATNAYSGIKVSGIKGDVHLTNSHSSIEVIKAVGKVDITAPQCRVVVEDVQGPVRLEASQREVRLTQISAPLDLKQRYGSVTLERMASEVKASLENTELNGYDLKGPVRLDGVHSHIRLEKLAGDIDIRNSIRSVTLTDFTARVQVESDNGSVTLSSSEPIRQPIQVHTVRGQIELFQPENARFRLAVSTQKGRIHSDFAQLMPALSDGNQRVLSGEIGTGGPLVTLESEKGNISIKKGTNRRSRDDDDD